jgi:dTDP-4-dehydrorhamnose reductase
MAMSTQIKKTVIITGANGLVGQKLVELGAKDENLRIIATGRGSSRLHKNEGDYMYESVDVTQSNDLAKLFAKYSPDFIIHSASMTDVDRCEINRDLCYEQNINATERILSECRNHGTHLIFISTDFVFDGKQGPYREDDSPNPLNYYGWTKFESEKTLQESPIDWTIIRTNLVYGVGYDLTRSNIVLWVKNGLEMGKELTLVDDQIRTPTLAEDLAMGCLLTVEKKATGIFNISGKDLLTPYDMGILTAEFFGLDKNQIIRTDSSHFNQVAQRPIKTGLLIEKAQKILGFTPKSFEEGIAIVSKQFNLAKEKF